MSWLSQFADDPIEYAQDNPWKAAALIGAPLAAVAAPFALPALGGAMGIGGAAAAGAEGAGLAGLFGGAEALGGGASFLGADAGALGAGAFGAEAGGLGGGLTASGAAGGGAEALLSSLGLDSSAFGADALSAFGSAQGGGLGADAGASGAFNLASAPGSDALAAQGFAPLAGAEEGAAASDPSFWDKLLSGGTKSITNNPLGIGLAAGGLGLNIMQGQKISPEQEMMKNNAASLNAQGQQLMSYMQSGTLPPGLKTAIDNATAAMRARIVANHASNGRSTNPAQNSMLTQELNQVDLNATALIAQKGQELLQSGMNATGMSNQLYAQLEALNQQKSQRQGQAIANFAAALSGPRPVQINTGGVQRAA